MLNFAGLNVAVFIRADARKKTAKNLFLCAGDLWLN